MNASLLRLLACFRRPKLLAAALLFCCGALAQAQVVRPFTLIFTTNKPADIAIIGNTLHTSSNAAVRNNSAAAGLLINNANWMARVDVDSDTNTFTSSSANFTLPTGGAVMFAKLYWGAGTNAGNAAASGAPNSGLRGQVLLSFNGGAYFSITNTTLDVESGGNRYQGSRDITAFVRTNGSGTYQVANVQSSTGSNTLAGWSIVVAYADPAAPPRNIALYDGYAVVQSGASNVDITISGFTTPQFNAVVTRVGVVAYEGDSGLAGGVYTGDQMRMNGVLLPAVADASTPTNDVFNSTISRLGTRLAAKNPDYTNQLGFDIKVLDATGVLTNRATSATITLTTGGEQYYPGAVAFSTELYAPQIAIPKTVTDLNAGAVNPGDVLLYNLGVTNSGGDWATNIFLTDPIPAGTIYVPNTFQITAGANVGAKTDAAGDDQLDFTNGVLVVRLGMGATATNGGVLSTNQSTSMSFMVRVATNNLHGTRLTNQATLSYSALVTGIAFANASTLAEVQIDAGIFGRVFEDVNYSGGAGRNYVTSAGVGLANARVELYNSANTFVGFTLSDSNGVYGFSNIIAGAYSVRVVNSSVASSRSGGGTPGLLPVQTFRTDASAGSALPLVNLVGGASPGATDSGNSVFAGAQSISAVGVTTNLYTGGVDFGFNFDTIVNANSSGQGSARQFIANANALNGLDRAVVMIPNGTAAPGLNAAFDFTLGGLAVITPATPLPAITDAVLFDATTQPGYAGVPLVHLIGSSAGAGANGFTLTSSGSTIRGLAVHGFSGSGFALTSGSGNIIEANVIGTLALPNSVGLLIATNATNNIIGGTGAGAANLIAFNTGAGVVVAGTTNVGNQIRRNSIFSNGGLGIDLDNNGVTLNDLNDADTGGNTLFNSPVITNAVISGANLVLSGYARPGSIIELFIAEPDATGFGEGRTYLTTVTEGVSDADATSGTYSGVINGINQGTDNTARFSFTIPLPGGVSVGTLLTATATDAAGNTSEFGGNAPVGGIADLVVFKSGPASTFSLNNITYTISVTNNGPATAVNVAVMDTLPAGVTFVSASSGGVLSNNIVSWPVIMNLASGARTNYSVTVAAPIGGTITNVASGDLDNVDPTPGNNDGSSTNSLVITAVTPQADVAVNVSGPASVLASATYSYTITVTNLGPATGTNVLTTNLLPAGVSFFSATGGGSAGGSIVTFPAFNLLASGATNFTVTVTAPASGSLTNRASCGAATSDPVTANNNGSAGTAVVITSVTPQADVAVGKSGPATVLAGSNFTYTISITNLGPSTASNVVASDSLPAQLTFVTASSGGTLGASNIVTWPALTLLSGARTNFTLTATAPASGAFTNIASATSPTGDPNPTNNNGTMPGSQVTSTVTPQADIVVTVTGPTNVLAGGTYTYTVTVTNLGVSGATNVLATNSLPGGVIFISTTGGGSNASGTVTWPSINLPAGTGTNFTITVTAPPSGTLTNTAAGGSITPDPIASNNNGSAGTAVVITSVTPQADVAVTVSGPATVLAGGNYTYTVSLTNFGPSVASNALASNVLPAGVTFVSTTGGGSQSGGNVIWPAITLPSGAGTNFIITVTAPPSGVLINRASGGSATLDPDLTNNNGSATGAIVTTTITPQADVAVGKSGPAGVNAGANFTYTLSITNLGPSTASNVVTVDSLPATVSFVSASGGGTLGGGNVVTWPSVTLAAGVRTNYTVTVTAPASGHFTNFASASSATGDPNPTNNNGTATGSQVETSVGELADIAVTVTGPGSVLAGGTYTYTVNVTNLGPSVATNVLATNNLPGGVIFVSTTGGGSQPGGAVTWPSIILPNGAGTNFIITVTAPPSGTLTNRAAGSSLTPDPDLSNNNGSAGAAIVVTTVTPQADVAVGKSGPTNVLAGTNFTYTISVTNLGPSTASNVVAVDTLPFLTTFVSASGGGTSGAGNVVMWPATTLLSGESASFTVTITAPANGVLLNRASASSATGDPNPTNNSGTNSNAQVTTIVIPRADLAVTVTGPTNVLASATYTYTVSIRNFGPSGATNALVTNTLPAGVTVVSISNGGVLSGNSVTWPPVTLGPGQQGSNLTITVTAPSNGILTNTVAGGSETPDPVLTNNNGTAASAIVTTTVTPQADVAVGKSGPANVFAGANFTYTISVTNFGPSTASNVVAQDNLPAAATFVSASNGGTLGVSNIVTWPATTLLSGATTNFTVTVTAPASGVLLNRASASSPTGDPNPTNNVGTNVGAQVTTTVTPQADVVATIDGPATVLAGATYTYTVFFTNLGPSTATNMLATNLLPTTVTFVSANSGGTLFAGRVFWPAATLPSGDGTSYTATVTAPASGVLTARGQAGSPTLDPNPSNNSGFSAGGFVTTTVIPQADVAVSKFGPSSVLAGANFNYTIVVTNLGPLTASNVIASDSLPASVTFVIASDGGTLGAGNVVTWPATTLVSGAAATFNVTVTAPASGAFTNIASASSPTGDPNPGNNTGTNGNALVTTTVTPQADVAVGKSGPASVLAGASFTYTISVTNLGPSTANNIVALDNLPANVVFVSASGGGTLGGGNVVTWPAINLNADARTNFTITVTAPASGAFVNVASASSSTSDPNPTNNNGTATGSSVSTSVTPQADIVVTVTGPTNALAGSNITYIITITNLGPSVATNAAVTNTLPPGVIFVGTDGGGTETNGIVTWPVIPILPAGVGTNFTITITVPCSGTLTNAAAGTSLTEDPNLANNNASSPGGIALTDITPQADVAVGKSGPASVPAGSNFVYTISLTNFGPSTASNIVAVDNLPLALAFVSASGGGAIDGSHNVFWPATTLAVGAVTNFTVTVTAPASGTFTNHASASSPTGDPNSGNNTGTNDGGFFITTIISAPEFDLLAAPSVFNPQTGLFEERVTVTNIGLTTAAAVRLNVTSLSANATFHNPSGINAGVPYAQYNSPLNPGQTVVFTLEFFVPNRRPFTNTLTVEAVLPSETGTNAGNGIAISRAFTDLRQPGNPRFVIEFPTTPGRVYTVLYRDTLSSPWKVATPSVTASANSTQWYDDGPPKTDGPPLTNGSRYYRVIVAPQTLNF